MKIAKNIVFLLFIGVVKIAKNIVFLLFIGVVKIAKNIVFLLFIGVVINKSIMAAIWPVSSVDHVSTKHHLRSPSSQEWSGRRPRGGGSKTDNVL